MMAGRGAHTLLLAVIYTSLLSSTLETDVFKARIRVKRDNGAFLSFSLSDEHVTDNLKLIQDPDSTDIYAGGPHGLYRLNPEEHPELTEVHRPIFECESGSTDCVHEITLLKEGRNGNPVFMCGAAGESTKCCDVSSEHLPLNCFTFHHLTQINQPSLHVGDSLYYTISGKIDQPCTGLYRQASGKSIWTQSKRTVSEQHYVKILANREDSTTNGKVYTFYMEQNKNQDPDMPNWTPRVSQICMADLGGSKAVLQYRWTSMLTARLFCGDEKRHLSYTELLDAAVLEDAEWENTMIYALFKNAYNLTAVCVYKMSDIVHVFSSNSFTVSSNFSSPRPGQCVPNSHTLTAPMLKFMEGHPELKEWIKPIRDPLMFHHHRYTHLQVDRVKSRSSGNSHHDVLFMSLENGNIHKILAQDGEPFIITEYEPFTNRTRVSSMLLDSENKRLFVSSSSEVIQINLDHCSVYGKTCESCVMARDPYCGWDWTKCSAEGYNMKQNVTHGNPSICEDVPQVSRFQSRSSTDLPKINILPQDSKFYLKCPMDSQHASYSWYHNNVKRASVSAEQDCLLLIESASKNDEGDYTCIATENEHGRTILRQTLRVNGAVETRMTRVALACILFLSSVIY